tara:strand:+ start:149 stop:391 length:243 start_codon:yes stop_codon:yes gene_type:complete
MSATEATETVNSIASTYSIYHKRSYEKNSSERKRKSLLYYHANRDAQNLKNKIRYQNKRSAILRAREAQANIINNNENII